MFFTCTYILLILYYVHKTTDSAEGGLPVGNTLYRLEVFPFYDYAGVERHLEEMAMQGWQPQKMYTRLWKYRKIEPQKLHYEVVYAVRDKQKPSERERYYKNIKQGEWQKVSGWNGAEVYLSAQEQPCSIAGDETERLEEMHRYKGGDVMLSCILLILAGLVLEGFAVHDILENPVRELTLNMKLAMLLLWAGIALSGMVNWITYQRWRKKMKQVAAAGGACEPASIGYRCVHNLEQIVFVILMSLYIAACWLDGGARVCILLFLLITSYSLVLWGTQQLLKKLHVMEIRQRFGQAVMVFLLSFPVLFGLGYLDDTLFPVVERAEQVTIHNEVYAVYSDSLPVIAEELGTAVEGIRYSYEAEEQETILLKRTLAGQWAIPYQADIPEFSYEIVDVKAGFLYDSCLTSCRNRLVRHTAGGVSYLSAFRSYYDDYPTPQPHTCRDIESDLWDGETVFRVQSTEKDDAYGYLLLWPERIVSVCMSWEPTEEQLAIIIEKMKPDK